MTKDVVAAFSSSWKHRKKYGKNFNNKNIIIKCIFLIFICIWNVDWILFAVQVYTEKFRPVQRSRLVWIVECQIELQLGVVWNVRCANLIVSHSPDFFSNHRVSQTRSFRGQISVKLNFPLSTRVAYEYYSSMPMTSRPREFSWTVRAPLCTRKMWEPNLSGSGCEKSPEEQLVGLCDSQGPGHKGMRARSKLSIYKTKFYPMLSGWLHANERRGNAPIKLFSIPFLFVPRIYKSRQ